MIERDRKKVLYVLHSWHNRAGTEEHTKTLARALSDRFETFIVAPEDERLCVFQHNEEIFSAPAPRVPFPITPYRMPAVEAALADVLSRVAPDIIHVQHLINWPLSLLDQLHATSRPVVLSLHDYYSLTPHYTMEGTNDPKETVTPAYAAHVFGKDISSYLKPRRALLQKSMSPLTLRVAPSNFLASLLARVFPGEYAVIPHGIEPFESPQRGHSREGLVLGYVGSLLPQKGFASVVPVFERLRERRPGVRLEVYGGGVLEGIPVPSCVKMHGAYGRKDLPEIMSSIDLGIIPSTFAETFSLVLSEYWQAKVPVVASRIGALTERIQEGINGALFEPGNVESMYEVLDGVLSQESWRSWILPEPRTAQEMVEEYVALYDRLISG